MKQQVAIESLAHTVAHWPGWQECVGFAANSYRILWYNIGAFLLIAAPWLVLILAASEIPRGVTGKGLVLLVMTVIGGSAVAIGMHRVLLLGETPMQAMRPRKAILQFLGLIGIAWAFGLTPAAVALMACKSLAPTTAAIVAFYALLLTLLIFVSAWLLAFPAFAVGSPRMKIRQAIGWATTPVAAGACVFAGVLVTGLPVWLLDDIIDNLPLGPDFLLLVSAVEAALFLAMFALIAGYSSALYRRLGLDRPAPA